MSLDPVAQRQCIQNVQNVTNGKNAVRPRLTRIAKVETSTTVLRKTSVTTATTHSTVLREPAELSFDAGRLIASRNRTSFALMRAEAQQRRRILKEPYYLSPFRSHISKGRFCMFWGNIATPNNSFHDPTEQPLQSAVPGFSEATSYNMTSCSQLQPFSCVTATEPRISPLYPVLFPARPRASDGTAPQNSYQSFPIPCC